MPSRDKLLNRLHQLQSQVHHKTLLAIEIEKIASLTKRNDAVESDPATHLQSIRIHYTIITVCGNVPIDKHRRRQLHCKFSNQEEHMNMANESLLERHDNHNDEGMYSRVNNTSYDTICEGLHLNIFFYYYLHYYFIYLLLDCSTL